MCMDYSNGMVFFSQEEEGQPQPPKWCKRRWPVDFLVREVVLVSKTHICSLNLLPLSGEVWL